MENGNFVIREPVDKSLAGQLTLPYVAEGRMNFVDVQVPSNGRFEQEDLRLLWDAGAELLQWQRARRAVLSDHEEFGRPEISGPVEVIQDWRSLAECAHDAAALATAWPTQLDRRSAWLPVGVPGGVEDVVRTEREVEGRGHALESTGISAVAQSARWLGDRRPLVSASVAALALAVVQIARASMPGEELTRLKPLLDPIAGAALLAGAPAGFRDPEPSSWPMPFIVFATSCMRAIMELQSSQRGSGVVPLLDTDELYEAWLAIQVRDELNGHLGSQFKSETDALAVWDRDGITYELWIKPTIPRGGRRFGSEVFVALVAESLAPDIVVAASRDDRTVLHALDAKSWATMFPESALEQSAKYLYGIRKDTELDTIPVLNGVDLVTSAAAPGIGSSNTSRTTVTCATPTKATVELAGRIRSIADHLAFQLG